MMDGAIDSSDDKVEVRDLTKKEGSSSIKRQIFIMNIISDVSARPAKKNKASTSILAVLDDPETPKKLPNGNFLSLLFARSSSMKVDKN